MFPFLESWARRDRSAAAPTGLPGWERRKAAAGAAEIEVTNVARDTLSIFGRGLDYHGPKEIRCLVVTHCGLDLVGIVPAIAARLPVAHSIDHGPSVAKTPRGTMTLKAYLDLAAEAKRARSELIVLRRDNPIDAPALDNDGLIHQYGRPA
ncbi:MAG: hypothetical protein HXY20_13740 [Acidobacteria bacterium]|nr:hypothetical protein [Acidobacteriota bacterium]